MNTHTPKAWIDSIYFSSRFPSSSGLSKEIYNGEISYQSQKVPTSNKHINQSRFFDVENPDFDLFHTIYHRGFSRYREFWHPEDTIWTGPSHELTGSSDESLSLRHDGLVGYRRYADQARHNALYSNIDLLKSTDSIYLITKIHPAFDIVLDTTIDHFLLLKLGKTDRINSPFIYHDKNQDGSRSYYPEELTKAGKQSAKSSCFYEKDMKEGLEDCTFRFEPRFEGDGLRKVGNNPEALIRYMEKNIGKYRLYHFDDVSTCNKFKEQYAENILKNKHRAVRNKVRRNKERYESLTPNVTAKLLREVGENSTAIPLELTDDIRKFITDLFDKNVKMEPPQFKKKVNHDRIKNCRIRRLLRQRWDREGRERLGIRERRNKQAIRRRIDGLQQCEHIHYQLGELKSVVGQVFNKQDFFVYATGPPYLLYQSSRANICPRDIPVIEGESSSCTTFDLATSASLRWRNFI